MKTSTVLASLLFGSFAAAAPVDKRALVYKTEIVTETVVVYTTVYDDGTTSATSSAVPTSNPAAFYEQQKPTTSSAPAVYPISTPAAASSTSAAPAYTPPVVEEPSSSATPTPTPTPTPSPEPVYTPAPVSSAPAATSSAAAPTSTAVASTPATNEYSTSGSATYSDVDITVYDNTGAAGACGESLTDDMMVVAISKGAWNAKGGSTYDVMTGASSNPWCGTEIKIDYNGATANAKIMDMCPGCTGENDIDLSRGVWKALGITEDTRLKASWSVV